MRGGGVGFYIKEYLNAQVIDELSPFENKIVEVITIKLSYPDKKMYYYLVCIDLMGPFLMSHRINKLIVF